MQAAKDAPDEAAGKLQNPGIDFHRWNFLH